MLQRLLTAAVLLTGAVLAPAAAGAAVTAGIDLPHSARCCCPAKATRETDDHPIELRGLCCCSLQQPPSQAPGAPAAATAPRAPQTIAPALPADTTSTATRVHRADRAPRPGAAARASPDGASLLAQRVSFLR